eukprot:1162100-Pelagomonas_calceolata.AAC.2
MSAPPCSLSAYSARQRCNTRCESRQLVSACERQQQAWAAANIFALCPLAAHTWSRPGPLLMMAARTSSLPPKTFNSAHPLAHSAHTWMRGSSKMPRDESGRCLSRSCLALATILLLMHMQQQFLGHPSKAIGDLCTVCRSNVLVQHVQPSNTQIHPSQFITLTQQPE